METLEGVGSPRSWANLESARLRDFWASETQMREKARQRMQAAIGEERQRTRTDAEAQQNIEAQGAAEAQRAAEAARRAGLAAPRSEQQAELSAQPAAKEAVPEARQAAEQRGWQLARPDKFSDLPAATPAEPTASYYAERLRQPEYPAYTEPPLYQPAASQPAHPPTREEGYAPPRDPPFTGDARASAVRPAWLATDRADTASRSVPQAPTDTLQGSRDHLVSRWYGLRGVFEGTSAPAEAAPAPVASRAPVMAVFSLAGGVGKTSLVATLGRALSGRGERVLLVDTTAFGLLPFFFGARDQRPGVLRTFIPPAASGDTPIQMVTIDPEGLGPEMNGQDPLAAEISKYAHGASRVIVDLGTASGATTRRVLSMSPMILVPLAPDMNSVVSVSSIDSFFQHNSGATGNAALPHYVLNQFDLSLPLHLDIREALREQLGDRLLPIGVRRAPAVSEALAEGMTVMDYAPNSTVAEDIGSLAGWVKSLSAPASTGFRGVRWGER